jgi:hypothetical protein
MKKSIYVSCDCDDTNVGKEILKITCLIVLISLSYLAYALLN